MHHHLYLYISLCDGLLAADPSPGATPTRERCSRTNTEAPLRGGRRGGGGRREERRRRIRRRISVSSEETDEEEAEEEDEDEEEEEENDPGFGKEAPLRQSVLRTRRDNIVY